MLSINTFSLCLSQHTVQRSGVSDGYWLTYFPPSCMQASVQRTCAALLELKLLSFLLALPPCLKPPSLVLLSPHSESCYVYRINVSITVSLSGLQRCGVAFFSSWSLFELLRLDWGFISPNGTNTRCSAPTAVAPGNHTIGSKY